MRAAKSGRRMPGAARPSPFGHAVTMLLRNFRSYAMLSVTILLSFTLLLGYLCFTDAQLYNTYKFVFVPDRKVAVAYGAPDQEETFTQLEQLVRRQDPNAKSYRYYSSEIPLRQYGSEQFATVTFLPGGDVPVYGTGFGRSMPDGEIFMLPARAHCVAGRESFHLTGSDVIVNEALFRAICPEGELPLQMVLPLRLEGGTREFAYRVVDVVGVCEDDYDSFQIYAAQELMYTQSGERVFVGQESIWLYTDYAASAAEPAQLLGMAYYSAAAAQDRALESIRAKTEAKGIITIGLFLLLGVNLFSAFSNALSDRKYEIGIKRALGATAGDIVRQFLCESLLVMLANIMLTIVLVMNGLVLYKLYLFRLGYEWVIYISGFTIAMFLVCCLSLTLAFSLLFAYKSTKVEIVQYLKAE